MKTLIFDIETGARPDTELADIMPEFAAPKNYKDGDKISSYIAAERAAWLEKAALSAVTGRIVAIGCRQDGCSAILGDDGEPNQIKAFWHILEDAVREKRAIVGWNINAFDLPFLARRSWRHGIEVPSGLFTGRGYPHPDLFVDLVLEWQCGDKQERISLGNIAKFLGIGEKNGDGKDFSKLWATERSLAVQYLENDLLLTAKLMERLLGISEIHAAPNSNLAGTAIAAVQGTAPAPAPAQTPAPAPTTAETAAQSYY